MEKVLIECLLIVGAVVGIVVGVTQILDRYVRHRRALQYRREVLQGAHKDEHA